MAPYMQVRMHYRQSSQRLCRRPEHGACMLRNFVLAFAAGGAEGAGAGGAAVLSAGSSGPQRLFFAVFFSARPSLASPSRALLATGSCSAGSGAGALAGAWGSSGPHLLRLCWSGAAALGRAIAACFASASACTCSGSGASGPQRFRLSFCCSALLANVASGSA